MVELWSIEEQQDFEDINRQLDSRQRLLLVGALNYHALVNPLETLKIEVYVSGNEEYPRLTDTSTITGEWREEALPIGQFLMKSQVPGTARTEPPYDFRARSVIQRTNTRYIRLSPTVENDAKAREAEDLRLEQRVYNYLERHQTFTLDALRESKIRLNELRLAMRLRRRSELWKRDVRTGRRKFGLDEVAPGPTVEGAPKAILIGMHWLQTGGAERWAFETVQIAKDSGLLPIVLTDQLSHHYWITRPELEGCLVLPLTMPIEHWFGDEPLLRSLVEQFNLRAILLHHCLWLYTKLSWFRKFRPGVPVVDSLHIIEYKGGGYPGVGVTHDKYIDIHHVISPQLERWMTKYQGVDQRKVVLAPLVGLTTAGSSDFKPRESSNTFTIGFVGRLARQKRPDIFLAAADALHKQFPDVRFILHGSGELEPLVERQIAERGLEGVVERRDEHAPVSKTYADSDVLLLTSTNEGLALTVFEAVAAGVPVVSTDVGSQDTLVPKEALLPRSAAKMVKQLGPLVQRLKDSETSRRDLWERERRAVEEFSAIETAGDWVKQWMRGLSSDA